MGERAVQKGKAAIEPETQRAYETHDRELQSQYDEALAHGDAAREKKINAQMLRHKEEIKNE